MFSSTTGHTFWKRPAKLLGSEGSLPPTAWSHPGRYEWQHCGRGWWGWKTITTTCWGSETRNIHHEALAPASAFVGCSAERNAGGEFQNSGTARIDALQWWSHRTEGFYCCGSLRRFGLPRVEHGRWSTEVPLWNDLPQDRWRSAALHQDRPQPSWPSADPGQRRTKTQHIRFWSEPGPRSLSVRGGQGPPG